MPYKTKSGTHYHETYGCCGATETCATEGLMPCRICCGNGANHNASAGNSAGIGGALSAGVGIFSSEVGSETMGHAVEINADPIGKGVGAVRHEVTDDYVMRLADSLLAIKASMDAARDGQYAPGSDEVSLTSKVLRDVIGRLPDPTTGSVGMEVHAISPDDLVGAPMTPREAFDRRRHEEFLDDFRRSATKRIRAWDEDGWREWRASHEDLAQYMKGNLRRERPPEYSLFIDEEVESLLRRRYEDTVPCPDWHLAMMWQRHGRLLSGREERWSGYDEAKRAWDAESERIWADHQKDIRWGSRAAGDDSVATVA